MFTLNPDANVGGTSRIGEVSVAPAKLKAVFGPSESSDGYKVSGEYIFVDKKGTPFTVYDYKSTSLYDEDNPSPDAFWNATVPMEFSVGGNDRTKVNEFKAWLLDKLK